MMNSNNEKTYLITESQLKSIVKMIREDLLKEYGSDNFGGDKKSWKEIRTDNIRSGSRVVPGENIVINNNKYRSNQTKLNTNPDFQELFGLRIQCKESDIPYFGNRQFILDTETVKKLGKSKNYKGKNNKSLVRVEILNPYMASDDGTSLKKYSFLCEEDNYNNFISGKETSLNVTCKSKGEIKELSFSLLSNVSVKESWGDDEMDNYEPIDYNTGGYGEESDFDTHEGDTTGLGGLNWKEVKQAGSIAKRDIEKEKKNNKKEAVDSYTGDPVQEEPDLENNEVPGNKEPEAQPSRTITMTTIDGDEYELNMDELEKNHKIYLNGVEFTPEDDSSINDFLKNINFNNLCVKNEDGDVIVLEKK